ncbi:dTDP-4-dehydrorhamnose 3,5-epimerase family protein [Rhodopirellula bahusiensis]|uniref:dTDP-4-dehydrorhamnose 3,5-epimerase family protein n=1 Tax=Rhodopirellula bahusiensis TaxID=2014065 RepID=UPI0013041C15|nr:dTDP-4-dehydrorhamnose 3,5-epimerase family protein [Rhodopirellula bahusiensis]
MITVENLPIDGSKLINTRVFNDNRGSFEVFWEQDLLKAKDISFAPTNAHHSYNSRTNTLRGMHFQKAPHGQNKLVSCISGKAWDVMVDLRADSSTFGKWHATELSAASGNAVLIPAGCGHGFITLQPNTTIAYLIEGEYIPDAGRVLRWDDTKVAIQWPCKDPILSEKDATAPDWEQCEF